MVDAMRLEAALKALRAGERGVALCELLAAWRETRVTALATLITEVGEEAVRGLPAVTGRTRADFQDRWLELERRRLDADVPLLMASLRHPPWTKFRDRVERLLARPPDPRIAMEAAKFLHDLPTFSNVADPAWRALLFLVKESRDARCRPLLETRLAMPVGSSELERRVLRPGMERVLEALPAEGALEPEVPLLRELRSALEPLRAGPPATPAQRTPPSQNDERLEQRLLEAVYAAPPDDAPRLVYADWLMERGSPRGEFIRLQLSNAKGAAKKRAQSLLRRDVREWLGPLESVVQRNSWVFERGFLAAARPQFLGRAQFEALADHPAWSTVTSLSWPPLDFLRACELRGLERIVMPTSYDALAAMAARPRPYARLTTVTVSTHGPPTEAERRAFAHVPSLPRLSRLISTGSQHSDSLSWLVGSGLGGQLEYVAVHGDEGRFSHLWALCEGLPKLRELSVGYAPRLRLSRLGSTWRLEAFANLSPYFQELKKLRPGVLSLVVHDDGRGAGDTVRRALRHLEVTVVAATTSTASDANVRDPLHPFWSSVSDDAPE